MPIVFEEESDPYQLDSQDIELLNIDERKTAKFKRSDLKFKSASKSRGVSKKRETDKKTPYVKRSEQSKANADKDEQNKKNWSSQKGKNKDNKKSFRKTKFKGPRSEKRTGSDKKD